MHGKYSPLYAYAIKAEKGRKWPLLMRSHGTAGSYSDHWGLSWSNMFCKSCEETRTDPGDDLIVKHYGQLRSIQSWSSFCGLHLLSAGYLPQSICMDFIRNLKLEIYPFGRVWDLSKGVLVVLYCGIWEALQCRWRPS